MGYEVLLFFGNSNIFPPTEREKRLEALLQVSSHFNLEVITAPYDHERWLGIIKGHEEAKRGAVAVTSALNITSKRLLKRQERGAFPILPPPSPSAPIRALP